MITARRIFPALAAVVVTAAVAPGADAATGAQRAAADRLEQRLAGERVPVDVEQLPVRKDPAKSFIGSLGRGDTFMVSRLSPSGKHAYGFAYGKANKRGWVLTSGLDVDLDGGARDSGGGLRLQGAPSVRYSVVEDERLGRYLSIGVVLRANRALDEDNRRAVAAPQLRRGEKLPDALFGGLSLRTIGERGNCYVGEVSQLKKRSGVEDRTWQLGLFEDDRVVTPVVGVTLKPADDDSWQQAAARRLGC